jgi:hypothetical protein
MAIKVGALLSKARARGEPFITIRFNSGAKSADFKFKPQLTAAVAQENLHTLHRKQAMTKSPAEDNSAPPLHSAASSFLFHANSYSVSQLPSPAERMRLVIAQGMSVAEQREQERQNARTEVGSHAEAAAAAAIPTKDLEAVLMQTTTVIMQPGDV